MRVYVPATVPLLAAWLEAGAVTAPTARAVTPALREWYVEGDEEELEFSALLDAATDALALLAADPAAARRRVVLAADVDGATPEPGAGPTGDEAPSRVRPAGPVPLSAVVSVHCDEEDAEAAVAAAAQVLDAAAAGDEDALMAVGEAEDGDLLWFDAQELPDLVARLRG